MAMTEPFATGCSCACECRFIYGKWGHDLSERTGHLYPISVVASQTQVMDGVLRKANRQQKFKAAHISK